MGPLRNMFFLKSKHVVHHLPISLAHLWPTTSSISNSLVSKHFQISLSHHKYFFSEPLWCFWIARMTMIAGPFGSMKLQYKHPSFTKFFSNKLIMLYANGLFGTGKWERRVICSNDYSFYCQQLPYAVISRHRESNHSRKPLNRERKSYSGMIHYIQHSTKSGYSEMWKVWKKTL